MSDNNQYYSPGGNNAYYSPGGNNAYYTPGGNAYYQPGGNAYYQSGNQHYYQADPQQNNGDDDEGSLNFNPVEWLFTFLHYWYLFVIAIAIALGLAMLKNRRWMPSYLSQGTIVIKENTGYGGPSLALMQGFGVDAGYKNVQNQMIMLKSYDLTSRVVDSLPFFNVEYITQGRFKTRQLFRQTPVVIDYTRLDARAYTALFQINFRHDGTLHISSTDETLPLDIDARYGEPVSCSLFDITIWPTEFMMNTGKIYFRFRDHESLIDEFMSRLQLSFVSEGSTVLALSMTSETPQRDCEYLDMLAKIYLLQNLEQKNEVAENSIIFINKQLENLQSSLQVSEGAMTDFRQENKLLDVSSYAGQVMGYLTTYDQKKMEIRLRETYFDYLINYIHTNIENDAVIMPTTMGVTDASLVALVKELNDIRVQRSELTEKNVYYAKYTKDMEIIKTSIEELVNSMRAAMDIEKQDLQKRIDEAEAMLKTLPEKELQMVAIERNYRIDDNYYTFFLQKRAEAEIQKASNTPDNSIMDKARIIAIMNAKVKSKTTTTYLVIGFLIPLALIILSELMNNKIRSPKDVVKLKSFRLIGTLRHARSQNPTLVRASPRSSYAEMMRAIRTRIEFVLRRKDKMVICVTSTESGDGKTFLCTNMASLYAMTGRKTLLVDLDLRKPNIHTKLGLESGDGLSNFLIGDCELSDILTKDTPFGFDFIRAGTIPPNPGELAHSEKLAKTLKELREAYDYIIIDTSPIGLVPDAYSIIENSDLCLFVIRCLQTNKSYCKQTLEQMLQVVEAPEKVQIVLSDIPTEGRHSYGSGYGYGYGGYGGYGYGHLGYGGYGGYGYGGYGYGSRSKKTTYYGKLYGKIYGRLTNQNEKDSRSYYYYHHDEDDEELQQNNEAQNDAQDNTPNA
ncbi:MAG: polysaccharide biosynthesis tyrosine autokinase [Paludibacteraceae bacterium]|nr:polysaccharide biosynthesis tyrosine autokinase [Paludibacteraceae bacterium]